MPNATSADGELRICYLNVHFPSMHEERHRHSSGVLRQLKASRRNLNNTRAKEISTGELGETEFCGACC
jgi:hypothetical protein